MANMSFSSHSCLWLANMSTTSSTFFTFLPLTGQHSILILNGDLLSLFIFIWNTDRKCFHQRWRWGSSTFTRCAGTSSITTGCCSTWYSTYLLTWKWSFTKKIQLTCWKWSFTKKMFCPKVQIMYYAGYRVLPEAPLREDWVQVINAIFNRTRIMVIRMIIIMAIQNLTSYFVHIVNFLPYSHQQLWMECLLQSQCLSIPLSTLRPLPW